MRLEYTTELLYPGKSKIDTVHKSDYASFNDGWLHTRVGNKVFHDYYGTKYHVVITYTEKESA